MELMISAMPCPCKARYKEEAGEAAEEEGVGGDAGDASADGNPAGCVVPFEVKSIGSWAMSAKVVEITPLLALTLTPSR